MTIVRYHAPPNDQQFPNHTLVDIQKVAITRDDSIDMFDSCRFNHDFTNIKKMFSEVEQGLEKFLRMMECGFARFL